MTYRAIAVGSPYAYELLTGREFPRELLPAGLEDWAGEPFYLNAGKDPVRGQALWAFAHGMAVLEIHSRFHGGVSEETWLAGAALVR